MDAGLAYFFFLFIPPHDQNNKTTHPVAYLRFQETNS